MSLCEFIQRASQEFEQKMFELGRNWDTEQLTGELAPQARTALVESFGQASRVAYQAFLESYDRPEPQIEHQGQTLRYKLVSPKTFLTSFGTIAIDRRLYQADTGGPSYVPLDQRRDSSKVPPGTQGGARVRDRYNSAWISRATWSLLMAACATGLRLRRKKAQNTVRQIWAKSQNTSSAVGSWRYT
jgi:hypothetical protein